MRSKLFAIVWLLVLPPAVVWGLHPKAVRGLGLDTSPEVVEEIQPGMTLEEVETIIGGPPGNYQFWPEPVPRFHSVSGDFRANRTFPAYHDWVTDRGWIEVRAGHDYGTSGNMKRYSGPVESVRWRPDTARAIGPFPFFAYAELVVAFIVAYWANRTIRDFVRYRRVLMSPARVDASAPPAA